MSADTLKSVNCFVHHLTRLDEWKYPCECIKLSSQIQDNNEVPLGKFNKEWTHVNINMTDCKELVVNTCSQMFQLFFEKLTLFQMMIDQKKKKDCQI